MNRDTAPAAFQIEFPYTDEILSDFESLYWAKSRLSPAARILCSAVGALGAVYFGLSLYREGLNFVQIGYLVVCSLMILVACSSKKRSGSDATLQKYRKYYRNKTVSFLIDDTGVEMKLEGQRNHARSKYQQIYGLFESKQCFYFVIKGKAYYIVSKAALSADEADRLRSHMERRCKKKFQFYEL